MARSPEPASALSVNKNWQEPAQITGHLRAIRSAPGQMYPDPADMKNRRNYYRLLQVQQDAPFEVIRSSFRALMRDLKHHPDLGGSDWDAALINEAYETLNNPKLRNEYDRNIQLQYS